jgi:hypothetical protein
MGCLLLANFGGMAKMQLGGFLEIVGSWLGFVG